MKPKQAIKIIEDRMLGDDFYKLEDNFRKAIISLLIHAKNTVLYSQKE